MTKDSKKDSKEVRLDKWLWAARFFKTRSLAHQAIEGGKVYIDGVRGKPSRIVMPGQELRINSPRGEMTVIVEQVSQQRGSASIAATFFRETEESVQRREAVQFQQRLARAAAPLERPNTQDRQILRRLKHGE